MKRQPCDHSRLLATIQEHGERGRRFVAAVEKLLEPHRPYADPMDGLRPGNSHAEVGFYCERCRTPWPCREFNELRWLYGEVNGYEPAKAPYERLVLRRKDGE